MMKTSLSLSSYGDGSKPWYLVNPKIAGKWMFIPLKMVLIGIDPYPYLIHTHMFFRCVRCRFFMMEPFQTHQKQRLSSDFQELMGRQPRSAVNHEFFGKPPKRGQNECGSQIF